MKVRIIEMNNKYYVQKEVEIWDTCAVTCETRLLGTEWKFIRGGFLNLQKTEFTDYSEALKFAEDIKQRKDGYRIVKVL